MSEVLPRLVYLTAPAGETELEFWRRKAFERAQEVGRLRKALAELLAERDENRPSVALANAEAEWADELARVVWGQP